MAGPAESPAPERGFEVARRGRPMYPGPVLWGRREVGASQMKSSERVWAVGLLGLTLGLLAGVVSAQGVKKGAMEIRPDHWDVSPPLREIRPVTRELDIYQDKEEAHLPKPFHKPREIDLHGLDPLVRLRAPQPSVSVTGGTAFDGVGVPNYNVNSAPPDTNGSVGRTIAGTGYYVQWVNTSFSVFNKATGAVVYGPANGNTLWSGFGGVCQNDNDGDPIVLYDKLADRWVFTQFAVSAQPFTQCVAVSTTSNPTGSYARYAFTYGNQFNDYPKVGVWPDGYYVTYNMFANGQTFSGGWVCAMDRAKMLTGAAATQQCFNLGTSHGGLLPSDLDGATLPPAGEPNYVLEFGSNVLNVFKFKVNWTTPASSTLTGPTALSVAAFNEACLGGTCVPQSNTNNKLDSLGDRLMYRLAYRNQGAYAALVTNHSVAVANPARRAQTGVRWYEVRITSGSPSLFQQGTFTNGDSSYRWMGSAAMDKNGNIALGYSVSSGSLRPAIRFTGRGPSDAPGTMGAEFSLQAGTGSQTRSLHRWGDYSSLSVDPDDDCTFWFTTEYLKASGSFNWSTRVGSFKLNGCN
jgi:hypothetical protein